MPQASDYAHIRAWHEFLGMIEESAVAVTQRAAAGDAPLDAIYARSDGTWATVSDIEDPERRSTIEDRAQELQGEEDARRAEEAEAKLEAEAREQEAADATRNADQEEGQDPDGGVESVQAERDVDSIDEGTRPEPGSE